MMMKQMCGERCERRNELNQKMHKHCNVFTIDYTNFSLFLHYTHTLTAGRDAASPAIGDRPPRRGAAGDTHTWGVRECECECECECE